MIQQQETNNFVSNYGKVLEEKKTVYREIKFLSFKSKRLKKRIFKCFCGQEYGVSDDQFAGNKDIVCPGCKYSYFLKDGKIVDSEIKKNY